MEVWIAPISALLGTLIGAAIPSITTIITNKNDNKAKNKEKYEESTRILITEFMPLLSRFIYSSKSENVSSERLEEWSEEIQKLFDDKLKHECPLDILRLSSGIKSLVDLISFQYMAFEGLKDKKPEDYLKIKKQFKKSIKELERTYKKINKKLKRHYI